MRLTDDDVDRIARRVVGKLVIYGLVIVVALWLAPFFIIAVVNFASYSTTGLPFFVGVGLAAALISGPVVLILWAWGRSKRAR
jgi:hypothetical protein